MASGSGRGSMSIGMKFIRFLIVAFNMALIVVGGALLGFGIYLFKNSKVQQLRSLFNGDSLSAQAGNLSSIEIFAIVLMGIGGAIFLIGFLGKTSIYLN